MKKGITSLFLLVTQMRESPHHGRIWRIGCQRRQHYHGDNCLASHGMVKQSVSQWLFAGLCSVRFSGKILNKFGRFIARELGVSGRDNMEKAQFDEIIDVLQDAINSNVC